MDFGLLVAFFIGIGIAILARPLLMLFKGLFKDADIRKLVSITAYYGAGIWTSLINAIANAVVSMSFKPLLSILRNPLRYYDYELVAGDMVIGLVGFTTWFLTVFAFYALLIRKVAESVGAKPKAKHIVPIAIPLTLLFLYAFGFRNSLYMLFWITLPYAGYILMFVGGLVLALALAEGE